MLSFENYVQLKEEDLVEYTLDADDPSIASNFDAGDEKQNVRDDYNLVVKTIRSLKHPKVKERLTRWLQNTPSVSGFQRFNRGTTSNVGNDGNQNFYTRDELIGQYPKPAYNLDTNASPAQMRGFKGATTKLANKRGIDPSKLGTDDSGLKIG